VVRAAGHGAAFRCVVCVLLCALFNYEHCGSSDMGTGGGDDDNGKVKREGPKAEAAGAAAVAKGKKGEL
jgi:hypothetical protein